MKKLLLIFLSSSFLSCSHRPLSSPPDFWSYWHRENTGFYRKLYWEPFPTNKGIDLKAFIHFMYTEGGHSQDDGDGMFDLAVLLFCIEQDPYYELLAYLQSNDPKKMVYAAWTIQILADPRFKSEIKKYVNDPRTVNSFRGDTLGKCMQSLIKVSSSEMVDKTFKQYQALWLLNARKDLESKK